MFDTVSGLPVHALVVHAVVVLLPVAAAGVVAIAVVSRWRARYGSLVLAGLTSGLVLLPVAMLSGNALDDRVQASGVVARQIDAHQELGSLVIWPTIALWALTVTLLVLGRRRRPGRALTVVAVSASVLALVVGGLVARVGHLGSVAVWSCTIGSDACR